MHLIVYILGGLFTHRAFVQISERRPAGRTGLLPGCWQREAGFQPRWLSGASALGRATCMRPPCPSQLGLPYRAAELDTNHRLQTGRRQVQDADAPGRFLLRPLPLAVEGPALSSLHW